MQQFSHMFTPVVTNLLIINALFFFATLTLTGPLSAYLGQFQSVTDVLALHYWKSPKFEPHQIVTHMFTHGGPAHFFMNMIFGLLMFGSVVERQFGPKRFLFFYFFCGLGAAIIQMAFYAYQVYSISGDLALIHPGSMVGASGAIMGILAAFGLMNPNRDLYFIFIPVPIKAKYMLSIFVIGSIFLGIMQFQGDSIAHFAHLGGMLFGFILMQFWQLTSKKYY